MPVATAAELAKLLDDHRLLDGARRAELATLQTRCTDSTALAQELLRRGWLTPYQANHLLGGQPGGLKLGPYLLLERLGEGGVGQVFKARHRAMNRIVALKVIRKELTGDPEVVQRFYREIRVISQLSHQNIIHAFDAGPIGTVHVLVMEFVEGMDLARVVKQDGPLPVGVACEYIRQAALGLHYAHESGLIHRDIKPSNLFVAKALGAASAGTVLKILDLGLARFQRPTDGELTNVLTPAGAITMGTPDYLAPEQAINFHDVDIRADIYSLGCTLVFLLTGEPPFPGGSLAQKLMRHQQAEPPSVRERRPELPAALDPIIRRMLAKRPEDRPATPAQVAQMLAPLAAAAGISLSSAESTFPTLANELGPLDPTIRESGSPLIAKSPLALKPWLLPAIGGALLLTVVGLVAIFMATGRRESPPVVAVVAPKPSPPAAATVKRVPPKVRVLDDFEQGTLNNWWPWRAPGDKPTEHTIKRELTSPGKFGKGALLVNYKLAPWLPGGLNYDIPEGPGRDWSAYHGVRLWIKGGNTGGTFGFTLTSNGGLEQTFRDDFTDWREIVLPFAAFRRDKESAAKNIPFDFRTVRQAVLMISSDHEFQGSYQLDQVELLEQEPVK